MHFFIKVWETTPKTRYHPTVVIHSKDIDFIGLIVLTYSVARHWTHRNLYSRPDTSPWKHLKIDTLLRCGMMTDKMKQLSWFYSTILHFVFFFFVHFFTLMSMQYYSICIFKASQSSIQLEQFIENFCLLPNKTRFQEKFKRRSGWSKKKKSMNQKTDKKKIGRSKN